MQDTKLATATATETLITEKVPSIWTRGHALNLLAIAAVPLAILWYSLASSPGETAWSRLVKKYEAGKEADARANIIHITMMEEAAADRQLFSASPRDNSGSPLRMPETLNFGSPWNVSAGHGTADLSELAKFYEERDRKAEKDRLQRLKKNNGASVYD
ncbi:hypothetical protein A1O3_03940 [Capronia epimyces CBS 606.96]|uniref:Transmembrane protein n=1 Tax=Capronia epimyces CBS 606.96 TaxID=1182542 RepID=W9Y3C0_9EURO|nr:uncharacterized protein A1O3_03940 [Capronia epimyces CBS 606.96]EXJ86983.1 hypothetical protein A1O3_03940 [Capronia epimyces CBS 606.96]